MVWYSLKGQLLLVSPEALSSEEPPTTELQVCVCDGETQAKVCNWKSKPQSARMKGHYTRVPGSCDPELGFWGIECPDSLGLMQHTA